MEKKIKICLIDDDPLFARGINSLFEEDVKISMAAGFNPINFSKSSSLPPERAEQKIKALVLKKIREADVILIDLRYRGINMNGLDLAYWITDQQPDKKLVLLSTKVDGYYGYQALHKLHLSGYLTKGGSFLELRQDILKVAQGGICYSPEIYEAIHTFRHENDLPISLTNRQREVLSLVVKEYSIQEIGEQLNISTDKVHEHMKNMKAKLGVRKIAGLVREAVLRKLVDLPKYGNQRLTPL